MKEASLEVLKRCRKSYEISQRSRQDCVPSRSSKKDAEVRVWMCERFRMPAPCGWRRRRRPQTLTGTDNHARRAQSDRQDRRRAKVSQLACGLDKFQGGVLTRVMPSQVRKPCSLLLRPKNPERVFAVGQLPIGGQIVLPKRRSLATSSNRTRA